METEQLEFKLKAEALLQQIREERKKGAKECLENELPKFSNPEDIPDLPQVDEKE